ncbi:hypothetical protein [Leifsonia sp. Root227]|uniref:hypothetical protein n=1 Tax=Leifsonia sp. Root227 TaxID=1736496 RepID=UPI0012F75361|nr:hypothetical protein [Leifsonia sp. Root227]
MLATYVMARRPVCALRMERCGGTLRFNATGGTILDGHDPTESPTSRWVNTTASRTCELCARPAKSRHKRPGARCDVYESLRGSTLVSVEIAFDPRLPLIDDAAEAETLLAYETDLRVPAGWARPVRDTIQNLGGASPSADYLITDREDHMALDFIEGDDSHVPALAVVLGAATRHLCKHCGRSANNEAHHGVCDGCRAVQARHYKVLSAFEDGSDGY